MNAVRGFNVPILAGLIVLKSARMARNLNANLPGVHVPDHIIDELEGADDVPGKSVEVSGRIVRGVREMCAGVHIMAIGWESRVPSIVAAAGLNGDG
jgi:5,10-methylenetetrahydrofolate reductase